MDVAEWKSIDEQKDGENDQLAGLNSHLGGKSDLFKGLKSQKETTTTGEQTGAWQPQQHPAEAGQGKHEFNPFLIGPGSIAVRPEGSAVRLRITNVLVFTFASRDKHRI
jgi:hypothetical protein